MPHGLVGQSFAWDGAKNGKTDEYPESGYYKTSAMAEGAIEGEAAMYQIASAYETHFAFSRFDASEAVVSASALPRFADASATD